MKTQTQNDWDREDRVHPKNLKAIRKIQLPTIKHRKQMYESLMEIEDDFEEAMKKFTSINSRME